VGIFSTKAGPVELAEPQNETVGGGGAGARFADALAPLNMSGILCEMV
jgi:hypothetical protein